MFLTKDQYNKNLSVIQSQGLATRLTRAIKAGDILVHHLFNGWKLIIV